MTKKKAEERHNGIGDSTVKPKTGTAWNQWFAVLDKAGVRKLSHAEIAAYLSNKQKSPDWWS